MSKKRVLDNGPSDTPMKHEISNLEPQIIGPLAEHLGKKWDDSSIQLARNFQGGWEAWLQVELASVLIKQLSYQVKEGDNGYVVRREYLAWNKSNSGKGRGICDVWIEPNPGPDHRLPTGRPAVVVELKVEYAKLTGKTKADGTYEQEIHYVRERFEQDMAKMSSGLIPEVQARVEECGIRKLCLAVTSRSKDLVGWKAIQQKYKTQVNYIQLRERVLANGEHDPEGGLIMLWWEDGTPVASAEPAAKQLRSSKL